jgi:hypothetical protein
VGANQTIVARIILILVALVFSTTLPGAQRIYPPNDGPFPPAPFADAYKSFPDDRLMEALMAFCPGAHPPRSPQTPWTLVFEADRRGLI